MSDEVNKVPEKNEDEKLAFIDYIRRNQQLLIVFLGGFIAIIIDRVFILDVFYHYPFMRLFVMPMFFLSIFISIYIGEKKDDSFISYLESFFMGNRYFFVMKAFFIIMAFINAYISDYETWSKYTYIMPLPLAFGLFRSLGLSGFFAILEKGLVFGQKHFPIKKLWS